MKKMLKRFRRRRREKREEKKRRRAYANDRRRFIEMMPAVTRFPSPRHEDDLLCLLDNTGTTGFDRHYVYHTSWAARVLAHTRPSTHVDVGSSLFFAGIASAFVPIDFYDYRPADLCLEGLRSRHADLMALPFADASVLSLSCMHVVEHVGLGRYGDPLDPDGDRKAIAELKRVVAVGGSLLFVVPVGRPRICFNAHRIYSRAMVLEMMAGLTLRQEAVLPDRDGEGLVIEPPESLFDEQTYGCGCFWFVK
jgi:SAM-dependent methyltransferase